MPDQNIETYLSNHLNTQFTGRQLHYYTSTTSTMMVAKEIARQGATEGTIIIADEQTSGRGRLKRTWLSPTGSLSISIILYPPLDILSQLIMVSSVAVVKAIREITGIEARIKWPNDILIDGKKVCGILIESEVEGDDVKFAIIGIGVNINLNPMAFPDISTIATSLSHELGMEISKNELTSALLSHLEQLYLEARNGAPIYKEWQANMETLGKWIQIKAGESIERGWAETVTENGNLVLRRNDGSLTEILVGDVTVIKE